MPPAQIAEKKAQGAATVMRSGETSNGHCFVSWQFQVAICGRNCYHGTGKPTEGTLIYFLLFRAIIHEPYNIKAIFEPRKFFLFCFADQYWAKYSWMHDQGQRDAQHTSYK